MLLLSVFFYLGRKHKGKTERTFVKVPLKIYFEGRKIETVTENVSEGGLAFSLDKPYYVPDDEELKFEVQDEEGRYQATVAGVIVHTDRRGDKWVYSVQFADEIEDRDKRELLQIIYDRIPTLPVRISRDSSYYADFKNNLSGRMDKDIISVRKLHRLELHHLMETEDHKKIRLMNFNYKYALVRVPFDFGDSREITVPIDDRLSMKMHLAECKSSSIRLYRILNYQELADDMDFIDMLSEWVKEADSEAENERTKMEQAKKAAAGVFNEMDHV